MPESLLLRVRNFLGVVRADIEIDRVVLVGGLNGAGKTSIIEAAASIVLETPYARGMGTRKAATRLLRDGSDAGSISLDYPGGSRRLIYPAGALEVAGEPTSMGSSLGIGSARLMGLKPDERLSQMSARFGIGPTEADLRTWFAQVPDSGLEPYRTEDGETIDPLTALWDRIEISGWDAVHRTCVEHGARVKGAWQATTGIGWGSRVARTWTPAEILPGETYDLQDERATARGLADQLEALIAGQAVSSRDRDELARTVAQREDLVEKLAELEKASEYQTAQADAVIAEINANPVPEATAYAPVCPHCGLRVRIVAPPKGGRPSLEAAAEDKVPPKVLKAAREADSQRQARLDGIKASMQETAAAIASHVAAIEHCDAAEQHLEEAAEARHVHQSEVDQARGMLDGQKRKVAAIENQIKAADYYAQWAANEKLIAAMHPDGVRRTSIARKLSDINASLAAISTRARWSAVELTPDMDATYDGRSYALLSESERWRVDLSLTVLLNQQEKARLILVDRLDLLAPGSRPGVIYLLRSLRLPALVAMTAKDLDACPKLAEAGYGRVLWLEKGEIRDPHQAEG